MKLPKTELDLIHVRARPGEHCHLCGAYVGNGWDTSYHELAVTRHRWIRCPTCSRTVRVRVERKEHSPHSINARVLEVEVL